MPALSYKTVGFQLEDLKARGDDGWRFSGYASTFGNVDLGGDVMQPGAFKETLGRRLPRLLWQHDSTEPIGKVLSLVEDDRGLYGDFKLSRTARGGDAYQLLKDGALDSMSIGYVPDEQELDPRGIRQIKSVELFEVSLVTIPMNTEALVTAVKAASSPAVTGPSVASMRLALLRKQLARSGHLEIA